MIKITPLHNSPTPQPPTIMEEKEYVYHSKGYDYYGRDMTPDEAEQYAKAKERIASLKRENNNEEAQFYYQSIVNGFSNLKQKDPVNLICILSDIEKSDFEPAEKEAIKAYYEHEYDEAYMKEHLYTEDYYKLPSYDRRKRFYAVQEEWAQSIGCHYSVLILMAEDELYFNLIDIYKTEAEAEFEEDKTRDAKFADFKSRKTSRLINDMPRLLGLGIFRKAGLEDIEDPEEFEQVCLEIMGDYYTKNGFDGLENIEDPEELEQAKAARFKQLGITYPKKKAAAKPKKPRNVMDDNLFWAATETLADFISDLKEMNTTINECRARAAELRETADGVSGIRYDKDKVQTSPKPDHMGDIVAEIADLEGEANATEFTYRNYWCNNFRRLCYKAGMDTFQAGIVELYLIEGMSFSDIARNCCITYDTARYLATGYSARVNVQERLIRTIAIEYVKRHKTWRPGTAIKKPMAKWFTEI